MSKWLYLLVLTVLASGSSPGTSDPRQQVEPRISSEPLHEVWTDLFSVGTTSEFGVEAPLEHPHAWISPRIITPGPQNGVIVLEDRTADAKLLFPDGRVIPLGSGQGSGPGEFQSFLGATWSEEIGILIADGPNRRITVFEADGTYVHDIHPRVGFYSVAAAGRHLWTNTFAPIPDQAYLLDTQSGEALVEVGGRYSDEPWAGKRGIQGSIAAQGENLLIAVSYPYEIQRFDAGGHLRAIFGRRVDWLGPPKELDLGSNSQSISPEGGMVGDIAVVPNVGYMVRLTQREWTGTYASGLPQSKRTSFFDVFSSEEEWLTTIPAEELLPGERIGAWTIASDGSFWCVAFGDYYRVMRVPLTIKARD